MNNQQKIIGGLILYSVVIGLILWANFGTSTQKSAEKKQFEEKYGRYDYEPLEYFSREELESAMRFFFESSDFVSDEWDAGYYRADDADDIEIFIQQGKYYAIVQADMMQDYSTRRRSLSPIPQTPYITNQWIKLFPNEIEAQEYYSTSASLLGWNHPEEIELFDIGQLPMFDQTHLSCGELVLWDTYDALQCTFSARHEEIVVSINMNMRPGNVAMQEDFIAVLHAVAARK